jgi:FkbM family methyltransferase
MISHHPIFDHFSPYAGLVEAGAAVDFIGAKAAWRFLPSTQSREVGFVQLSKPPVDEEYFEWIDILESVVAAREQYTMVELGAGYGRWAVRAACAWRQVSPGMPLTLVAAEAEPVHFRWMNEHFRNNGLDPDRHRLIQAAVGVRSGVGRFYIGMPSRKGDEPNEWYGQALAHGNEASASPGPETHDGHPVLVNEGGWRMIEEPVRTLSDIVGDIGVIDLIDLDVQGEEANIIESSAALLDKQVRRLHIGTHSHEIEARIRSALGRLRWAASADYPCQGASDTPYGTVTFGDGVQSWMNPKLV